MIKIILALLLMTVYLHSGAQGLTSVDKSIQPSFKVDAPNGEQLFIKHADECLAIIEREAVKIPMTGVAMVAFIPGDATETWISKMKVVGKIADNQVNLLGIVYTKAAEMAVTLKESGNADRKNIRGEYGYQGGVILKVKNGYILSAFSGGKGQDDVDAARKGLLWLAEKYH